MAQSIDSLGPKKNVLFICCDNAARSQMAEAFLNARYGESFQAYSGGTDPQELNKFAVQAMNEVGLDISNNRVKSVDELIRQKVQFDIVVTVCDQAAKECPFFPAKEHVHKPFEPPQYFYGSDEEKLERTRKVRDEIGQWIDQFFPARRLKPDKATTIYQ